jgi:ATP-binding cassette subfamily F protein uup
VAEILVSCQELSKAFGAAPLFEGLSLGVFEDDHIGLVGPNGSGKSTLLRILAGLEPPSSGSVATRRRLRIGYVPQDPVFASGVTVGGVLEHALSDDGAEEHEREGRVAVALGRAGFTDAAQPVETLSGGWKKRLAIARELVRQPELLLLDEPTNHLDVEGILWLEELLPREPEAFVAVSHDRYFLEAVAGRVIELNRAFSEGLLDCAAATAASSRRRTSCSPARRPTASLCAIACGASSSGCRARHGRARARHRRGSTRRAACARS